MNRLICLFFSCLLISNSSCTGQENASQKKNDMTLSTEQLKNAIVKSAIEALQSGNSQQWLSLFTSNAELYDDGNKIDFQHFSKNALGHERFTSIDKIENNGLDLYGKFHSDQWGDFKTYFKFHVNAEGKIFRLEIGQANY